MSRDTTPESDACASGHVVSSCTEESAMCFNHCVFADSHLPGVEKHFPLCSTGSFGIFQDTLEALESLFRELRTTITMFIAVEICKEPGVLTYTLP
ncbi:hypothetical protein P7K49_000101 [Saguinus oedipus]|uniref:Uncharacterized protein n=1 Tax=Saguinus oedipus TaxID=9490 RepID=A0ABQ9WAM5_SAGOE|nr:hypothetical protein P7K49_000101 [Saguinus oedipus]